MKAISIESREAWVTMVTRPIRGMVARSATMSSMESTPTVSGPSPQRSKNQAAASR